MYLATGTVYLNGLQLEKGDSANNVNLIDNSSFEIQDSSGYPDGFNKVINSAASVLGDSHDGSRAFRIDGEATGEYNIRQAVMHDGKAGEVYTFGGWAKAVRLKHLRYGRNDHKHRQYGHMGIGRVQPRC